jgi:hypothetical protein
MLRYFGERHSDGTWKYADETSRTPEIQPQKVVKTPIDITRGGYVLLIDEKKWRIKKQTEADRQLFTHVSGDAYVMAISERLEIPISSLRKIALDNAREAAPDAQIVLEEKRRVNGLEVVCLQITGTTNGVPFTYYGYYHSNPRGTVQLVGYTGKNLFNEYQADLTDLLSGLKLK